MAELISIEQLHVARSKFIDAFASIEHAITNLLSQNGVKIGQEMLGQKIELLRNAKPSSRYSKTRRAEIHEQLKELVPYLGIRADIVHGKLNMVELDGHICAFFINSRNINDLSQTCRVIRSDEFESLARQLDRIAAKLRES